MYLKWTLKTTINLKSRILHTINNDIINVVFDSKRLMSLSRSNYPKTCCLEVFFNINIQVNQVFIGSGFSYLNLVTIGACLKIKLSNFI